MQRWLLVSTALTTLTYVGCSHKRSTWAKQLEVELANADRLRVKASGSNEELLAKAGVLVDEKDPAQIRQLLAAIDIDESESDGNCACYGGPTMEFLTNGKVVAIVSVQHGKALRWVDGPWQADAKLTGPSRRSFQDWMAARGLVNLEKWVSRTE